MNTSFRKNSTTESTEATEKEKIKILGGVQFTNMGDSFELFLSNEFALKYTNLSLVLVNWTLPKILIFLSLCPLCSLW